MATHSSVLAWRIPGTGEPGGLPSMGLHRVRHNWSDLAVAAASSPLTMHWIRQNSYEYYILCLVCYWSFPLWLVVKRAVLGSTGVLGIVHANPFLFLFPKPWVDSSHTCMDQSQLKTHQGLTRILSCLLLYLIKSWPLCPLLHLLNSERPLAVPGFFLSVQ